MKFNEYLEETGISITKMAYRCGVTFHRIYHIKNGKIPTLKTACIIDKYTKGKVSPKDLLSEDLRKEIYGEA